MIDTTTTEGHSLFLEFVVNDATRVAWYKDGIILPNAKDYRQISDCSNAILEIDEIFEYDDEGYACAARNQVGENIKPVKLCNIRSLLLSLFQ